MDTITARTAIAPARLRELRAEGQSKVSEYVDLNTLVACSAVLERRGEPWAEAVLGRALTRRCPYGTRRAPWLTRAEEHVLIAADHEEDTADPALAGTEQDLADPAAAHIAATEPFARTRQNVWLRTLLEDNR